MPIKLPFSTFICTIILKLTLVSSEKSCETPCSDQTSLRCGAWMYSDNNRIASGIYLLDEGYANLTCAVTSLPRPTEIHWYFEPEYAGHYSGGIEKIRVQCSSMRKLTECKYNEFGEHRVTSICLLKITQLEQSGSYFCSGHLDEYEDAESSKIRIHAYGISNISLYDSRVTSGRGHHTIPNVHGHVTGHVNVSDHQVRSDQADHRSRSAMADHRAALLHYGRIGHIKIRVCAHPKPQLVWIHRPSGRTIAAGHSSENETASLLYDDLNTTHSKNGHGGPMQQFHYCYVASLILGRVHSNSSTWTVVVWNSVDTKRFDVPTILDGEPAPKNGLMTYSNCAIMIFVLVMLHGAKLMLE